MDPLVLGVAAVSVVVYRLHGFHGTLTRDLGVYSYAGQQVADGVPAYLGVLNRAGPLAHAIPGAGVLVAGLGDVTTMRVTRYAPDTPPLPGSPASAGPHRCPAQAHEYTSRGDLGL